MSDNIQYSRQLMIHHHNSKIYYSLNCSLIVVLLNSASVQMLPRQLGVRGHLYQPLAHNSKLIEPAEHFEPFLRHQN